MEIQLQRLNYTFSQKPLLVGGMAMEYYGLRKSGDDIDLKVPEEDVIKLIKMYPDRVKHLWGDLGVCPFEFEIWRTICLFDYDFLKEGAIETDNYLIISKEKLLFMKALGMKEEKYLNDAKLIVESIFTDQKPIFSDVIKHNEEMLNNIGNISYIERRLPESNIQIKI